MKRLSLLLLISLFCTLSLATALNCNNNPSQLIMRLSTQTNAHVQNASAYGTGNYPVEVCYNEIFGQLYTGANPFQCTGTNTVVKISAPTNAHVAAPSQTPAGYLPLCYGDVGCTVRSACQANEQEVLSLSALINAHVETPGANQYDQVLCCSRGGIVSGGAITAVRWEDSAGRPITEACVNRTVYMAADSSLPNTQFKFEVWEDDPSIDDPIRTGSEALFGTSNTAGSVRVPLSITDQDYAESIDTLVGDNNISFYFVSVNGTSSMTSQFLQIRSQACVNTPPVANISRIFHRAIIYQGSTAQITQSSTDLEGGLMYNWSIAEDSFSSSSASLDHTFSSAGQKTITLRVTDDQGLWDEDQIAVLVIGSEGIFGFINRPAHHEIVVNNQLQVSVSANDSFVVENEMPEAGCPTVSCLAGNCPEKTFNAPAGCTQNNLPVLTPVRGFESLFFNWSFSDGTSFSGQGIETGLKTYASSSVVSNDKQITLTVDYDDSDLSLTRLTTRSFTLLGGSQCKNNGNIFVDLSSSSGVELPTMVANGACRGPDGMNGTVDDCCPTGHVCSGSANRCIPDPNANGCSSRTTQNSCNNAPSSVVRSDALYGQLQCGQIVNGFAVTCSCAWNSSSSSEGSCALQRNRITTTVPGGSNPSESQCLYSYTVGACSSGYKVVSYSAQCLFGTCDASCDSSNVQNVPVPCGSNQIELGFFGTAQLLISVGLLAIVYLVIYWYTRKK